MLAQSFLLQTNHIHVINLQTNQEIGKFLDIGNGPNEFVTPNYSLTSDNNVVVYDMSQDKMSFSCKRKLFF